LVFWSQLVDPWVPKATHRKSCSRVQYGLQKAARTCGRSQASF